MSHYHAAVFRGRADHLRGLAAQIAATPSMSLHTHAGVDTWHGPRPDECCSALTTAQRGASGAIEDLRIQAQRFDETADRLDADAFAAERAAEAARREQERLDAASDPTPPFY